MRGAGGAVELGSRGHGKQRSRGHGKQRSQEVLHFQAPLLAALPAPLPIACQLLRKQPCCSPCAVLLQAKLIISNKPMFKLQNQAGAS